MRKREGKNECIFFMHLFLSHLLLTEIYEVGTLYIYKILSLEKQYTISCNKLGQVLGEVHGDKVGRG